MDEGIKKQFDAAVEQSRTREKKMQDAADAQKREREEFLAAVPAKFFQVIVPALQEVAEYLNGQGWQAQLTGDAQTLNANLEMYKGDKRRIGGGHSRPGVTFTVSEHANVVHVIESSVSQGGGAGDLELKQIDKYAIQSAALTVFKRLANGK
jgi:hypothetical protein